MPRKLYLAYIETTICLPPECDMPSEQSIELTQPDPNFHLYTVQAPMVRDWTLSAPTTNTLAELTNWGVFCMESEKLGLSVVQMLGADPLSFISFRCVGDRENAAFGLAIATSFEEHVLRRFGFLMYPEGSEVESWVQLHGHPGDITAPDTKPKTSPIRGSVIGNVASLFKTARTIVPLQSSLGSKSFALTWWNQNESQSKIGNLGNSYLPVPLALDGASRKFDIWLSTRRKSIASYEVHLDQEPGHFTDIDKEIYNCAIFNSEKWRKSLVYVCAEPVDLLSRRGVVRSNVPNDNLADDSILGLIFTKPLGRIDMSVVPGIFLNALVEYNMQPDELLDDLEYGYDTSLAAKLETINQLIAIMGCVAGIGGPPETKFIREYGNTPPMPPRPTPTGESTPNPRMIPTVKYRPPKIPNRPIFRPPFRR